MAPRSTPTRGLPLSLPPSQDTFASSLILLEDFSLFILVQKLLRKMVSPVLMVLRRFMLVPRPRPWSYDKTSTRPPRRLPSSLSSKSSTFAGNLTNDRPSATLDLTLLLLVRALDSIFRSTFLPSTGGHESKSADDIEAKQRRRRALTTRMDAFVFWASSARCVTFSQVSG